MPDVWTIGPTAAARALCACGFSPRQAERLVVLKLRYERGDFRELTTLQKRLLFIRWLVEHGRLDEGQPIMRGRQNRTARRILDTMQ